MYGIFIKKNIDFSLVVFNSGMYIFYFILFIYNNIIYIIYIYKLYIYIYFFFFPVWIN